NQLLTDEAAWGAMSWAHNPYGDRAAAPQIINALNDCQSLGQICFPSETTVTPRHNGTYRISTSARLGPKPLPSGEKGGAGRRSSSVEVGPAFMQYPY